MPWERCSASLAGGAYVLAFLAHDDGSTGILAGRKNAVGGDFRIFKQHQGYHAVIVRCFRVIENGRDLLEVEVRSLKQMCLRCLVGELGSEPPGRPSGSSRHRIRWWRCTLGADLLVFRGVRTQRERVLVMKRSD